MCMHILIAPNAFKNSLSAMTAAEAIKMGLECSTLTCTSEIFPIGDGGDGTGSILLKRLKGVTMEAKVHDPLGRMITADFGLIDNGKTAVIELASASGLRKLTDKERNPLRTSTFGTGELIKHALDRKVNKIILCIGGSATVDGATGILSALGVQFLDDKGVALTNLPADLIKLGLIDTSQLDKRAALCEWVILSDVENPLLGKDGAARIFGPQKGAGEEEVHYLDAALNKFGEVVLKQTGKDISSLKHGGAAGGTAAGLYAFLEAKLQN